MTATTDMRTVEISEPADDGDSGAGNGVLVLVYRGSGEEGLMVDRLDEAVLGPLTNAFKAVQRNWSVITDFGNAGRVIVLAPTSSAFGDPDRPLDSAVTGGLISFVRSVALELRKSGGTANAILFSADPDEPACQELLAALASSKASPVSGQEIYAGDGDDLGRLRP